MKTVTFFLLTLERIPFIYTYTRKKKKIKYVTQSF